MASYSTSLISWGATGQAYPTGYSYVEGEQPVDAWDNFFNDNVFDDLTHLINLTNARLADESGTEASAGGLRLQNSEWLAARNAADGGDVNLWQVNGSDEIEAGALVRLNSDLLAAGGELVWDESAGHVPETSIDSTIARDSELYTDEQAQDAVGTILTNGLSYDDANNTIEQNVVLSGQVTLSSGEAIVDTGISAVDATLSPALGVDDPDADTQVSAYLFWDDSVGTYHIKIIESETAVGNPTVNYDIVRIR